MTSISPDVIQDLLPLYLAGEASPGTRRLVEEYLQKHPEMLPSGEEAPAVPANPPATLELRALDRTRQLIGWRNNLLGLAAALSGSVFTFVFRKQELVFVLYRDQPAMAWVLLALSMVCWVLFLRVQARLRRTGLAAPASVGARLQWMMVGALALLPLGFVLSHQTGWECTRDVAVIGAFTGAALEYWIRRQAA